MTTIRKIVTSKIDGDNANNTSTNEIRPFGELAVYIDNDNNGGRDKLELLMFDGARTHLRSKVLSKGTFYGGDADSADQGDDGIENFDTIKLIPDAELHYNDSDYGNDQYIVIDPTTGSPGHIHIRAGGAIDNSSADLYLGGEQTFVRVSDTTDNVAIRTGLSSAIENVEVEDVDELVPPGGVWRMFFLDADYPTLGTTVQIGETVTTSWGTPITATIVDIEQDAGKWQIHVDQDITVGHNQYNTVTFNRGSKTWLFGSTGDLTVPANSSILTNETELKIATHSTTTYTFNQAYWEALNGNATRMLTITGNAQYFSCTVTANQDGTYTVADLTGNSFEPGDWFKVPGNELGGATPANDIQINIATVDGEGVILTTTITGTAVGKQWQFGTDGTTTLPQGGTISEVTVTPFVGGNPSVGILLTPFVSDEFGTPNPDMAVKIYPTFNDDDHIHIVAGNPGTVDLFLGDDIQYVKLEADGGNVVISADDPVGIKWTFDVNGRLTLPKNSSVREVTPATGAAKNIIVIQSASSILNTSFASLPPAPISNYVVPGTDIVVNVTWSTNGENYHAPAFVVVDGGSGHTGGGESGGGDVLTVPYADMGISGGGNWTWYVVDIASDVVLTAGLESWRFAGDGSLTFPDATVQTTALVQGEQVFTLDTGAIDYAPTAVDFNLLFVTAAIGYSGTDPTSVTLPNGTPGQRLVIFNGYNLATLTVNPGVFGRDISSGVAAEFIYSGFDGLWMPLYGTNSPT